MYNPTCKASLLDIRTHLNRLLSIRGGGRRFHFEIPVDFRTPQAVPVCSHRNVQQPSDSFTRSCEPIRPNLFSVLWFPPQRGESPGLILEVLTLVHAALRSATQPVARSSAPPKILGLFWTLLWELFKQLSQRFTAGCTLSKENVTSKLQYVLRWRH